MYTLAVNTIEKIPKYIGKMINVYKKRLIDMIGHGEKGGFGGFAPNKLVGRAEGKGVSLQTPVL